MEADVRPSPSPAASGKGKEGNGYVVVCAAGFEQMPRVRSALMFASLAASAGMETVLYCVQGGVDVMVRGAIEKHEKQSPGTPSIAGRLADALELGVRIECCTQTMANKGIEPEDLIPEARPAGAMNLITLTTRARGSLSF